MAPQFQLQDAETAVTGESEVKFQVSKDTLGAMLRSMAYIREQLPNAVGVPVYAAGTDTKPSEIAKQGLEEANKKKIDVVIMDTAGRLQIDKSMMDELKDVKRVLNPTEVLLVVDAMIGQEVAGNQLEHRPFIVDIFRRNELAWKVAKDFLLDLQSGTLELGAGVNEQSSNKFGQASDANSDDEVDAAGKRKRQNKGQAKEIDISTTPKAHNISSEPKRILADIEQAQALICNLDLEKEVEENILAGLENDKMSREKSHGSSTGPVVIMRGLTSVKGLEGVELLKTLLTYLWRVHGLDYYGMMEMSEAKGLRHVRPEGKNSDAANNGAKWEKKLDSHWQERLKGQDPLEVMTAKEEIDAAAAEALDPFVRKIRDEKYGWKYGCGAKGCTKLFHAAEFVHKHPELVLELT